MKPYSFLIFLSFERIICGQTLKFVSELDTNFAIKCPEKHGIYRIDVDFRTEFLTHSTPFYEWQFAIFCKPFVLKGKTDKEAESCEDKRLVSIAKEELIIEDLEMSCDCNQYVTGINGEIQQMDGRKQRLIGVRCCQKNNNYVQIQNCSLTDPFSIYNKSQFNTADDRSMLASSSSSFITGISIYENMMAVQKCVIGVFGHHEVIIEATVIKAKLGDDNDEAKCNSDKKPDEEKNYRRITGNRPFEVPWQRPNLGNVRTQQAAPEFELFTDQITKCPVGHLVYSVSKYARFDPTLQLKDYVFHVRCAEFEDEPCNDSCSWNSTCDEDNLQKECGTNSGDNTVECRKYLAGLRSTYNKQTKTRKFEFYCCNSQERAFKNCHYTKEQPDSHAKMILPKPRIHNKKGGDVADAIVFHEVIVKHVKGNLVVQYQYCDTFNSSSNDSCSKGNGGGGQQENEADQGSNQGNNPNSPSNSINGGPNYAANPVNNPNYRPTRKPKSTRFDRTRSHDKGTAMMSFTPLPTTTCGVNFVIMLDSSGSLGPEGYEAEKDFIKSLLSYFEFDTKDLGYAASSLALIEFGKTVVQQISFTDFTDSTANDKIDAKIDSLTWFAETTNILGSLELSTSIVNGISSSDPRQTIAVLLTDGYNNEPDSSEETHDKLLLAATTLQTAIGRQNLYGVGVSPDAAEELPLLVDPNNFLYAATFADLESLVNRLKQSVCDSADTTVTSTAATTPTTSVSPTTSTTTLKKVISTVVPTTTVPISTTTTRKTTPILTTTTTATVTLTNAATTQTTTVSSTPSTATRTTTLKTIIPTVMPITNAPITITTTRTNTPTSTKSTLSSTSSTTSLKTTTSPSTTSTSTKPTTSEYGCAPAIAENFPGTIYYDQSPLPNGFFPDKTVAFLTCAPGQHWNGAGKNNHLVTYRSICANGQFRAFAIGNDACIGN